MLPDTTTEFESVAVTGAFVAPAGTACSPKSGAARRPHGWARTVQLVHAHERGI
jgi:hypothetical protein